MSSKYLNDTGLAYFWTKLKAFFAPKAHTHSAFEVKHSYTVAANAAKNWYRIANASTQQLDTSKPIHAQFIITAYNTSYAADYYERWFVNVGVFGRTANIVIFGATSVPFSQARVLYENTVADIDANDRPAIDIYLNCVLPNGTTKIEIEEVYNNGGWTFLANGQLAASTVPSGFESVACSVRNNGVERSTYADYVSYLNRKINNITAAFTLADTYLYRSSTLNCTGTFTITIPSINSGYMWCVIKNKNTSSGVITLHPSTTSVFIDGSNADITLQPMEYVCIHSAGANNYSLIADGRWKSQKADKATTLEGYGITDAKIVNGTITLGSSSITPLTSVPSHNQASDTITAMTGYSKPSSTSAISTSDTLNQAMGKLEAKVDAADGLYVHSSGNEDVSGNKHFKNWCIMENGFRMYEDKSDEFSKGSNPPAISYGTIFMVGDGGYSTGGDAVANRLLEYHCSIDTSGITRQVLRAFNNTADATDWAELVLVNDHGTAYATCPTPVSSANDTKIATTAWVRTFGDSTYVHITGNETISGSKTFNNHIHLSGASGANTIFSDNKSGALYLAVSSITDGANLILHGSSYGSTQGWFYLEARKGTTKRQLNASPSGNLYWNGAAVQTSSDERLKTSLTSVPDDILDSWGEVEWGAFKYLDAVEEKGDSARYHIGLIAQAVDRIFDKNNVNIRKYGILCYEKRDAVKHNIIVTDREAFTDENGVYHPAVTHDEGRIDDPVDLWMIRYTEALCMEAAYMRRENARLKKRVADLEERLAALELKIS